MNILAPVKYLWMLDVPSIISYRAEMYNFASNEAQGQGHPLGCVRVSLEYHAPKCMSLPGMSHVGSRSGEHMHSSDRVGYAKNSAAPFPGGVH